MKRVGALVGAVAMIVAAFVIRGAVFGDDGPAGSGRGVAAVVCAEELAEACRDIGATTRPVAEMADQLIAADLSGTGDLVAGLDADTFVLPAAWAALIQAERQRLRSTGSLELDGEPVASSAVQVVMWDDERARVADTCRAVDWACLADEGLSTGMPPVDTGSGLVVAAAQAVSLLGGSDFAANDFGPEFESRATDLAAGQQNDPVRVMLTQGPGRLVAAGDLAMATGNRASNFGSISTLDATSGVRSDVVVLAVAGAGLDGGARTSLGDALIDAGWREPVPGDDGLPAGGTLAAIRTLWGGG